jgi:hypothetical protein
MKFGPGTKFELTITAADRHWAQMITHARRDGNQNTAQRELRQLPVEITYCGFSQSTVR